MLHQHNQIALLASDCNFCRMLYPSEQEPRPRNHAKLSAIVTAGLKQMVSESAQVSGDTPKLSSALATALCYLNAGTSANNQIEPRLLVVQASDDTPAQYISMMNCIFAAQRMEAYIDACVLGAKESVFLQQACHITQGVYWRVSHKDKALLQYLLTAFLPGRATRSILQLPQPETIDLRAMCFDTKTVVDLAHVCSVCLSIFSQDLPTCATCGVEFHKKA
eukprot:TRINITY_DN14603_c0_g1_i2.p1 TRINITY_DN14603_c0_g1~~TRINITY_DN14603_c0_g1_i2.p1  ORF type:complete len:221 (+),score=42.42 TRINITY_DN14603_c0_g1_i2:179-841(+)